MLVLFFQLAPLALLFHFPRFLEELGASRTTVGTIASVGMFGGLVLRLVLGSMIDRLGPKRVWVLGNLVFSASVLGFILVTALGPAVSLLRGIMAVGWMCVATAGIRAPSLLAVAARAGCGVPLLIGSLRREGPAVAGGRP
jgi:MFS family permease